MKIIIIDDEQNILDLLERFLLRSGKFEVESYTDSLVALEKIKNFHYDLVLTDIMMPGIDGMELLKKIKEFNPNIKIMMMTAYSTVNKVIDANHHGADDYITKPFVSLRDVENKVLDMLGL